MFEFCSKHTGKAFEKWNISCHISKQRMSESSAIVATKEGKLVNPEGTQEGKNTCHLAAIRLQPLPVVNLSKGNSGCENTGYWPQMRMKGMISVSLHSRIFPYLVQFSCSVMSEDAAHQATLSITNARSLLKLMSIEPVMPSNHLVLCCPLLLLPSIFPSIRVFSNESVLRIRWPKYWSFSFSISPSVRWVE